jgi:hypothetical protein
MYAQYAKKKRLEVISELPQNGAFFILINIYYVGWFSNPKLRDLSTQQPTTEISVINEKCIF